MMQRVIDPVSLYEGFCEGVRQRPGKKLWGQGDATTPDKTDRVIKGEDPMIVPLNKWVCSLCNQEISAYDTTTHHPHCYYNSFRTMMPDEDK